MINFNMSTNDNFASFEDTETGLMVFVESYDHKEFEVRVGTPLESKTAGVVVAMDNEQLNKELSALYAEFKKINTSTQ